MEWMKNFENPPQRVFVTHGEPESSSTLAAKISDELGFDAIVPAWQQTVDLFAAVALDPLKEAYASISAKLLGLIKTHLEPARREEILRRLAELEAFLDEGIN
ncbi:MAG: hypothetical protein A4E53_02427 [Pelotomaculum sp. PtaB.Bin104]|nr:MAG: hypothetical protein A4E53_02427 [Pelotomaculum sp. PtaB.Bin104]